MLSNTQPLRELPLEVFSQFPQDTISGMFTPLYAKSLTSPSLKYKIFHIQGEDVLVLFKQVSMFSNKFIRLLGFPISKSNNTKLEIALFKELTKINDVKEVQLLQLDAIKHNIDITKHQYENVEFIVPIQELPNKYKTRYQINKYEKDIEYREVQEKDIDNIIHLTQQWIQHKQQKEEIHSKKIFSNICKKPQQYLFNDFKTMVLYYRGELFAYSIYQVSPTRIYQLTNIINTFSTTLPHNLIKGGNRIVFYYTMNYFKDYKDISYMGSINSKSNVFKNKQMVYKTYEPLYKLRLRR
jgi:hypothetical protein